MARYRGPKSKIARRFNEAIFGPDKALDKKYKSIKEDLVREAFPNFLPPPAPKTEVKVEKSTKKSSAPSKV